MKAKFSVIFITGILSLGAHIGLAQAAQGVVSLTCTFENTNDSSQSLPDFVNGNVNVWVYDVNASGVGQGIIQKMGTTNIFQPQYVLVNLSVYSLYFINNPGVEIEDFSVFRNTGEAQFVLGHWANGYAQPAFVGTYSCSKSNLPLPKPNF